MVGAFKFRVRLVGLGGDGDIGAVPCRAQGDGKADAAAGAGDEEGLSLEVRYDRSPFTLRR